jgi:HEAT repeat protein
MRWLFVLLLAACCTKAGQAAGADSLALDEAMLKAANVAVDGPGLLDFFRKQTRPGVDRTRIDALIKQLGDDSYDVRQKATLGLIDVGESAVPQLRDALRHSDPEVVFRSKECLQRISTGKTSLVPLLQAACRLLAARKPPGTIEVLLGFLPSAEEAVAEEVRTALAALAVRDGKPEPLLVAALSDKEPLRRATAADVFARHDFAELRPTLRALLRDPEPSVRLPVAVALLKRKEAEAVPIIIGAIGELPAAQTARAEEMLRQLAGGAALGSMAVGDSIARPRVRAAWSEWWGKNDGPALLAFFTRRTPQAVDTARIEALIKDLGNGTTGTREAAVKELVTLGNAALPLLRREAKSGSATASHAAECLVQIRKANGGFDASAAVVRLLALRKPAGAAQALLAFAPFAEDDCVIDEIVVALADMARQEAGAGSALVNALTARLPETRGVAADALCRAGLTEHQPAVRKLLGDSDANVRLRAALTLAAVKDREAIPVLIALLAELPQEKAWRAEDFLVRLAGSQAPDARLANNEAARKQCRDAWSTWWQANRATADLTPLEKAPRLLGYTLIVMLDRNSVLELDNEGLPRWQLEGFVQPLDVQILPGERLLTAEHDGNKIVERNLKGDVLWQKTFSEPLMAQRLPNGNTFVGTRDRIIELDREGHEVFAHLTSETIMRGRKLPTGEFVLVTTTAAQEQRVVRLDGRGRELKGFNVTVNTRGGRLDVQPDGRVLIPEHSNGKVVEYDTQGKSVWEVSVPNPIAAVRLPNGNTLITSCPLQNRPTEAAPSRAIEFDRKGREVWQYKSSERVTRAYRR